MRLKRMLTFEIAAKNLMSFLVNVSLANVVSTSLLGNEISWSPTIAVVDSWKQAKKDLTIWRKMRWCSKSFSSLVCCCCRADNSSKAIPKQEPLGCQQVLMPSWVSCVQNNVHATTTVAISFWWLFQSNDWFTQSSKNHLCQRVSICLAPMMQRESWDFHIDYWKNEKHLKHHSKVSLWRFAKSRTLFLHRYDVPLPFHALVKFFPWEALQQIFGCHSPLSHRKALTSSNCSIKLLSACSHWQCQCHVCRHCQSYRHSLPQDIMAIFLAPSECRQLFPMAIVFCKVIVLQHQCFLLFLAHCLIHSLHHSSHSTAW